MRLETFKAFVRRLALAALLIALVLSGSTYVMPVAAQTADGSPVVPVEPTYSPPEDVPVETEAPVAPLSLVTPTVIAIDTMDVFDGIDPCSSIDATSMGLWVDLLTDVTWSALDGAAGGNLFVDYATDPPTFSWDALAGGTVLGAIVPDTIGVLESPAYYYDYRPFGGSVGGDAGLRAPAGLLSGAFLCLLAPVIAATETATGQVAIEASPSVIATNEPQVAPAAIGIGSTVRVTEALNLRTAPSLSGTVIAVLAAGTTGTVLGGPQSADGYIWWQISTTSGTGWSVGTYLAEQPVASTPTRTVSPTTTRTPTQTAGNITIGGTVRVTQLLNLRSGPGTTASVIAVMPTGTIGTVLAGPQTATGRSWWQISTSLGTGWAAADYLRATSGGVTSTPTRSTTPVLTSVATLTATPTTTTVATTPASGIAIGDLVRTTARVNLREGPGTQATVITVLPSGSQGPVLGGPQTANGMSWWQVQMPSGTGWVAAPYLARTGVAPTATVTRTPSTSPVATQTRTPSITRTTTTTPTVTRAPSITPTVGSCGTLGYGDIARATTSVNLRSTPSTSGTIIRTLSEGERGTVRGGPVSANGYTWCQLQFGSVTGWVASQYLARVSGPIPTPNGTVTPRPEPPDEPSDGSSMVIYGGSTSSGKIALTFDAGADRGMAGYILDVLADYGVHATFGMTGLWAQENPDLVARMVAEGHQLINHTWSHPSFTGGSSSTTVLTRAGRVDQLDRAEAIVESTTGYQMAPYWRPPYGDINASVLRDVYTGGYYVAVMWTCDSLGWNGASEQQILNRCMYPMGAGDIILMHVGADGLDWAATDNMIEYFQGQGLEIVTVEDLLSS